MRNQFRKLPDKKIAAIIKEARHTDYLAEDGYKGQGGISPDLALQHSDGRLKETVAAAVVKERLGGETETSHLILRNDYPGIRPSAKKEDRNRGGTLRERRGSDD